MDTFGKTIRRARMGKGLMAIEVAAQIIKENGEPISPQYLNDLEFDRRGVSPLVLEQLAALLGVPADYLYFLSGELPPDLRAVSAPAERVVRAMGLLRQELKAG